MEFNLSMSSQKIENRDFDAVIIGSGAAGMSAAVYAARSGLKVVILDQSVAGGLTAEAPLVENYLGFKAIKGTDLASNFAKHAQEYLLRYGQKKRVVKSSIDSNYTLYCIQMYLFE